jgi:hypothetical protein
VSLDSEISRLTVPGVVTVYPDADNEFGCSVVVTGADGDNCTCRDVVVQACLHAIGVLQCEVLKTVQEPGGGSIGID